MEFNSLSPEITKECILTTNETETVEGQELLHSATSICFLRGDVKFSEAEGTTHGLMVIYNGADTKNFRKTFEPYGFVTSTFLKRGEWPSKDERMFSGDKGGIHGMHYIHPRDFTGLIFFGNATPSDIDAVMEFDDKLIFIIEAKCVNEKAHDKETGQERMMRNVCDGLQDGDKRTFHLIGEHPDLEDDQPIDFGRMLLKKYRHDKKWEDPENPSTTVQEFLYAKIHEAEDAGFIDKRNVKVKEKPARPTLPYFNLPKI
jgi:hypothetical protein